MNYTVTSLKYKQNINITHSSNYNKTYTRPVNFTSKFKVFDFISWVCMYQPMSLVGVCIPTNRNNNTLIVTKYISLYDLNIFTLIRPNNDFGYNFSIT